MRNRERSVPLHESPRETQKESEQGAPVRDVRLFLLQSKLPEMLPQVEASREAEAIASLQFTEVYFARKKSRPGEPDRIVPIGGVVEEGESLQEASIRRVVEQTHVRPTSVSHVPMPTRELYQYISPEGGEAKERNVSFATARLLPRDKGYALDPARTSIEEYVGFTIPEWEAFLQSGKTCTADGTDVVLTGNLMIESNKRLSHDTVADQSDVEQVHREFLLLFRLTEADKKLHILKHLVKRGQRSLSAEDYAEACTRIDILVSRFDTVITEVPMALRRMNDESVGTHREDVDQYERLVMAYYDEVTALWQDVATRYQFDDIRETLGHSNLAAELRFATNERFDMSTGRGFPTIDLLLPVLIGDKTNLTFREKKILLQNPRARNILRLFGTIRSLYETGDDVSSEEIIEVIRASGLIESVGSINMTDLGVRLDDYFDHLLFEKVSQEDSESTLRQEPEVLTRTPDDPNGNRVLERLVRLAQPSSQEPRDRVVQFEAQRKLVLMLMLHEGLVEKDRVLERDISAIRELEKSFFGVDDQADHEQVPCKIDLDMGGTTRQVRLQRLTRTKSDLELLRKMITRDAGIGTSDRIADITGDTFGEAIIIETVDDVFMRDTDVSDLVSLAPEVNGSAIAPQVVRAYLERLQVLAQERRMDIAFVDFKPLPGEGEAFVSRSAGGGDVIRMLKFDLRHRESDDHGEPIDRYREVQLFLPKKGTDGSWHSGMEDFLDKKAKDEAYGVNRLFMTRESIKSFIELMFPTEIYGDSAQQLYRNKIG